MTKYIQPHVGCEHFQQRCQYQPFCICLRTSSPCSCGGDMRMCAYFPDIQQRGRDEEAIFISTKAKESDYISRSALLLDIYEASKTYNEHVPTYIYQTICRESGGTRC